MFSHFKMKACSGFVKILIIAANLCKILLSIKRKNTRRNWKIKIAKVHWKYYLCNTANEYRWKRHDYATCDNQIINWKTNIKLKINKKELNFVFYKFSIFSGKKLRISVSLSLLKESQYLTELSVIHHFEPD